MDTTLPVHFISEITRCNLVHIESTFAVDLEYVDLD